MSVLHGVLTVLGGALELGGFALIFREVRRIRRVELGQRSRLRDWVGSTRDEIRQTIANPAHAPAVIVAVPSIGSSEAFGHVQVSASKPKEEPQVVMRRELDALARRLEATEQRAERDRARVDRKVQELVVALQDETGEQTQQRKEDLRRAAKTELNGMAMFVVGIGCNVAANLIP